MRNSIFATFFLLPLLSCGEPANVRNAARDQIAAGVRAVKARFGPDNRTDRITADYAEGAGGCDRWTVRSSVAAARPALDSLFAALPAGYCHEFTGTRLLSYADSTRSHALVRVSVANLRTRPGHSEELTTQATLGTPLELLDRRDHWWLVRSPDRYIAWVAEGEVSPLGRAELAAWLDGPLRRYLAAHGTAGSGPTGGGAVTELVAGNLVRATGQQSGGRAEIELPDGHRGWVAANELGDYAEWARGGRPGAADLLATARTLGGVPYLWGGTSGKAVDCSGFTKMAYFLNGWVIPRDASQQVLAGTAVALDDSLGQLAPGDLLFFGNHRADGSERTTHVGFYLGGGRMLHAGADNGRVAENSLRPGEPDYAAHRRKSLLRARRLAPGSAGVVPVATAFTRLHKPD